MVLNRVAPGDTERQRPWLDAPLSTLFCGLAGPPPACPLRVPGRERAQGDKTRPPDTPGPVLGPALRHVATVEPARGTPRPPHDPLPLPGFQAPRAKRRRPSRGVNSAAHQASQFRGWAPNSSTKAGHLCLGLTGLT